MGVITGNMRDLLLNKEFHLKILLEEWDTRGKSPVKWRAGTLYEEAVSHLGLCASIFSCLLFCLLFYCRLVFIACHFVTACIKLSSVGETCYKIRFKQTPLKGKSLGTRRHSRKFWVGVYRRGLQTLTLFKTRIVHFANLFKTRQAISRPWFISFYTQN